MLELTQVSQGSILDPLLFIIFFNDIASLPLSPSTKLFIYADDVLLLHPANCPADIASLNLDLQTISLWLSQKSLRINITKSKYMFFSFRAQSTFNNFFLFLFLDPALKEFVLTSISVYFLHLASSPGSLAHSCRGEAPLPPWEWARVPGDEAILTPTLSWTLHINLISPL